jgi:hypothetical protein
MVPLHRTLLLNVASAEVRAEREERIPDGTLLLLLRLQLSSSLSDGERQVYSEAHAWTRLFSGAVENSGGHPAKASVPKSAL